MSITLFSRPVRRWLIVGAVCVVSVYVLGRQFSRIGHRSDIVSDQEVDSEQVAVTKGIDISGRNAEPRAEQNARTRMGQSDVDPGGEFEASSILVVHGRVTDEYLNPITGALVCFGCSSLPDPRKEPATQQVATGEDGRFRYEAPPSTVKDSLSVRVTKAGFSSSYKVLPLDTLKLGAGAIRHDVTLKGSALLTGVVRRGSLPAPGIRVDLTPMLGIASLNRVWTDESGRFNASALKGRTYRITAVDRGKAFGLLTNVPSGQGQIVDVGIIELSPGARVQAMFVYPDGRPVSGLKVFVDLQGGKKSDRSIRGKESGIGLTDKRGILQILGMSSGRYAVTSVSVMDKPHMSLGTIDANAGMPIIRIPYHRVRIEVQDKSGNAIDPVQYEVRWQKVDKDGHVSDAIFDSSIRFIVHAPKDHRFLVCGSSWQVSVVVRGVKISKRIIVPFNKGESRVILVIP